MREKETESDCSARLTIRLCLLHTQVRVSANLRVYIMALEVDGGELLRVLKPSLPLERLHLDSYSSAVTDGALELVAQQYHKTLTHLLLLRDDGHYPDLSVNRNEDPLVLLAWRCTHLAVLVIHGEGGLPRGGGQLRRR